MREVMSCGVLVVKGDPIEQFLLMEHADRLDLPKGHVDEGETELECALRELVEETAITVDDLAIDDNFRFTLQYPVWPSRFNGEECKKTLVVFLGRLTREVEIVPTEHEGFRWVAWSPPHSIQTQTIDPLLSCLEEFLASRKAGE